MDENNPYRNNLEGRVAKLEVDMMEHNRVLMHRPKVPKYVLTRSGWVAILLIPLIVLLVISAAVCGYIAWGAKPIPIVGVISTGLIAGVPSVGIAALIIGAGADEFWEKLSGNH